MKYNVNYAKHSKYRYNNEIKIGINAHNWFMLATERNHWKVLVQLFKFHKEQLKHQRNLHTLIMQWSKRALQKSRPTSRLLISSYENYVTRKEIERHLPGYYS